MLHTIPYHTYTILMNLLEQNVMYELMKGGRRRSNKKRFDKYLTPSSNKKKLKWDCEK